MPQPLSVVSWTLMEPRAEVSTGGAYVAREEEDA